MYLVCSLMYLLISVGIVPGIISSKSGCDSMSFANSSLNLVTLYSDYDDLVPQFAYSCSSCTHVLSLLQEISYFCWKDISRVVFELEPGIKIDNIVKIRQWFLAQGLVVKIVFMVSPEIRDDLSRYFSQETQGFDEFVVSDLVSSGA